MEVGDVAVFVRSHETRFYGIKRVDKKVSARGEEKSGECMVFDGGKFFDHGDFEIIVLFKYERLLVKLNESWVLLHGWHLDFIKV